LAAPDTNEVRTILTLAETWNTAFCLLFCPNKVDIGHFPRFDGYHNRTVPDVSLGEHKLFHSLFPVQGWLMALWNLTHCKSQSLSHTLSGPGADSINKFMGFELYLQ
jgi:hypothetical protein